MVRKELEAGDPFDRMAIAVPSGGEESLEEMALCFAAEFTSMGWDEPAIVRLFQQTFYQGPHLVYQKKGLDFVKRAIRRAVAEHKERLRRFGSNSNPEWR